MLAQIGKGQNFTSQDGEKNLLGSLNWPSSASQLASLFTGSLLKYCVLPVSVPVAFLGCMLIFHLFYSNNNAY